MNSQLPAIFATNEIDPSQASTAANSEISCNSAAYLAAKIKIDKLFRLEYYSYVEREGHSTSLSVVKKDFFQVPMYDIIPVMEGMYKKHGKFYHKKVNGKLARVMAMIMRNNPNDHSFLIRQALESEELHDTHQHANEIRVTDEPPKFMTFWFDYRSYFNNVNADDQCDNNITFST